MTPSSSRRSWPATYTRVSPPETTLERTIAKRPKGTVYLDYVQVGEGKTLVAPFSAPPPGPSPGLDAAGMGRRRGAGPQTGQGHAGPAGRLHNQKRSGAVGHNGDPWSGAAWKPQRLEPALKRARSSWFAPPEERARREPERMAHAIWSGAISFGLVTIPVKLFTAVRTSECASTSCTRRITAASTTCAAAASTARMSLTARSCAATRYEKGRYVIARGRRFQERRGRGDPIGGDRRVRQPR